MRPETKRRLEEIESLLSEINTCLPPCMEMSHKTVDKPLPGVDITLSLGEAHRGFFIEPHNDEEWGFYGKWCERFALEQVGELAKRYARDLLSKCRRAKEGDK